MTRSKATRVEDAKEYMKKNLWKQVIKQKIYELGIVPLAALAIWFIPYWVGLGMSKIISVEFLTKLFNGWVSSRVEYVFTRGDLWTLGFVTLFIIAAFIVLNILIANKIILDKAKVKFDVSDYDIYCVGGDE